MRTLSLYLPPYVPTSIDFFWQTFAIHDSDSSETASLRTSPTLSWVFTTRKDVPLHIVSFSLQISICLIRGSITTHLQIDICNTWRFRLRTRVLLSHLDDTHKISILFKNGSIHTTIRTRDFSCSNKKSVQDCCRNTTFQCFWTDLKTLINSCVAANRILKQEYGAEEWAKTSSIRDSIWRRTRCANRRYPRQHKSCQVGSIGLGICLPAGHKVWRALTCPTWPTASRPTLSRTWAG